MGRDCGATPLTRPNARYAALPHPPQSTQVECRGQQGPLSRDVGDTPQQESARSLLLFDDPEDRLDQTLPTPVQPSSFVRGHPDPMTMQVSFVGTHLQGASMTTVPRTDPKGWARPTDNSRRTVQPHGCRTGEFGTCESQCPALGTDVAVALLVVPETLLVVWQPHRSLLGLRHHHPLASTGRTPPGCSLNDNPHRPTSYPP